MFEQYKFIKSTALANAWLRSIVDAYGHFDVISYPDDCAELVEQFARAGVTITTNDANSFWNAYSDNMSAGWMVMCADPVAALDGLVADIEDGCCYVDCLVPLRGAIQNTD
jgi:hypothetical protein